MLGYSGGDLYRIAKRFAFSASHSLSTLEEGHPCSRLHGHNYEIELELSSDKLVDGMVVDYGDLSDFKLWIDSMLDHRHLNDCLEDEPTAENMARALYEVAKVHHPEVSAVRVSETPKTWAEYRP